MFVELIKDAILQNIGPLKPAPKNWKKRNCMLCATQGHNQDTRNRFGIQFDIDSISLNCFNCGFSANFEEHREISNKFKLFLKQIGIDDKFIKEINFQIFKEQYRLENYEDITPKYINVFDKWIKRDLPKDSLTIQQWLECGLEDKNFLDVVNYTLDRKIYELDKFY